MAKNVFSKVTECEGALHTGMLNGTRVIVNLETGNSFPQSWFDDTWVHRRGKYRIRVDFQPDEEVV